MQLGKMRSLILKKICRLQFATALTILLSNVSARADCIVTDKGKNLNFVVNISGTFDEITGDIAKGAADVVTEAAREKLTSMGQQAKCPSKITLSVNYSPFFAKPQFGTRPADHQTATDAVLASPWMDISINYDLVDISVSWNERQIVYDQRAVAAGVTPALKRRTPIIADDFARWCKLYEDVIPLARSPDERAALVLRSNKDVPPDVLWILQTSWQSTRAPFCGLAAEHIREVLSASSESYLSFLKQLVLQQKLNLESKTKINDVSQLGNDLADVYPKRNNDITRRTP